MNETSNIDPNILGKGLGVPSPRYFSSAVVDKHFVDKIGNKTAILRKYDMSTMILFCWHNNDLFFWKRKDKFKKQNIVN